MKTRFFLFSICSTLCAFLSAESRFFFAPLADWTQLSSKNTGTFHGGAVGGIIGYQYRAPMALFARACATGDWSDLNHIANSSQIHVTNLAANANLGFNANFGSRKQYTLAPYSGYAYRYLQEHRSIAGFDSYYITYKKPLIPLGISFLVQISSFFSLGLDYQYQFDIDPSAKLNFMKGAFWELKKANDQSIEAILTFKICEHWDVQVVPYYTSIKTGRSTAVTSDGASLGIQKQTYQMYGGSFGFSYLF